MIRLAVIIPSFSNLDYLVTTLGSLDQQRHPDLAVTPIVIDDYSPDSTAIADRLKQWPTPLIFEAFPTNGGLTRSWNRGLQLAAESGFDVACVTNNDVIFAKDSLKMLVNGTRDFSLVGPVTNAPGPDHKQHVTNYLSGYAVTDDLASIDDTQQRCAALPLSSVVSPINGFCMLATMQNWKRGRYDSTDFFCPVNHYNSKGQKNNTPLMTLNECELQARWRNAGAYSAIITRSFVFHYRSVSRGIRHGHGSAYRRTVHVGV